MSSQLLCWSNFLDPDSVANQVRRVALIFDSVKGIPVEKLKIATKRPNDNGIAYIGMQNPWYGESWDIFQYMLDYIYELLENM